jgi:hypothetical protein
MLTLTPPAISILERLKAQRNAPRKQRTKHEQSFARALPWAARRSENWYMAFIPIAVHRAK